MTDSMNNSRNGGGADDDGGGEHVEKLSAKNFSYFGLFTCLATLVLAFIFKVRGGGGCGEVNLLHLSFITNEINKVKNPLKTNLNNKYFL